MGIHVDIQRHESRFINEKGKEVYPPGHPDKGMVRPKSPGERSAELPPKSLAEEKLEVAQRQAELEATLDDEDRAALERLRAKGVV